MSQDVEESRKGRQSEIDISGADNNPGFGSSDGDFHQQDSEREQGDKEENAAIPHGGQEDSEEDEILEIDLADSLGKDLIKNLPPEKQQEVIKGIVAQRSLSYRGLVPHPDQLNGYTKEQQERIFRMAESHTTDQSSRLDKLVAAEIANHNKGRNSAMIMYLVAMVFAFGTIVLSDRLNYSAWIATAFIALPVVSVINSMITGRNSSSNGDDADE